MFSTNKAAPNESFSQESYASALRRDDTVRQGISFVLEDFSLLDDAALEYERIDWII